MKFHHIGIACLDISETYRFIEKTFSVKMKTDVIFDALQNVELCMVTLHDDTNIELVSGTTVDRFVKKRQHLYHTCWEVEDISKSLDTFIEEGAMLISEPKPAILFDNRLVAFVLTELGIVELLEVK